jgi:hypothetical protein
MRAILLAGLALGFMALDAPGQGFVHRALDATAVTVSGAPVVALTGPANGCNISSGSALIVSLVGPAGTVASGTSQLQAAAASPYQCGPIAAGVQVSVNCSGAGTCSWSGDRW